ncbi:IS4 family transposase (plasmid) [Candidatus Chlorohelix allophototropha]|uniref:IS4 family transposase n=1 Tax=Candidatus Chlorohelix allophototropha TaxID=3003348 RepID=A0ABY9B6D9_9CHLR|nr:IS4 family transposase [Chloroflexota bacterium L227-S17]WJW68754.1 IS4 family transposase [Chloroflexota bacterium L227-S17]WJW70076.1 IS4 family transposase [Chloroflexota bacterium L227-S17]
MRHTRAIALDRSKRPTIAPPPEEIEQLLAEVVQPNTFSLIRLYQEMGLRARTLTLPVMLAFVLSLIWRQIGAVSEAVRVIKQEGMLWQPPIRVTQQAISQRLREMPAALFEAVLNEVLPLMHQRWRQRQRPLPPELQRVLAHFSRVAAVDGSTLDALIKKTGLLREIEGSVLAGKMMGLLDVASQLPLKIWYGENSAAHDQSWWEAIIETLETESLTLFDLGFVNYGRYRQLTVEHKYFVTRVKSRMDYRVVQALTNEEGVREWLIAVGSKEEKSEQVLRLVAVEWEGKSYCYLSNVLERSRLTGATIAYLYRQRWRIEEAFKVVKRQLGLAYFHAGSINAICLQVWATWLLYCVLIDLTDSVAEELKQPFKAISVEMVYRGLYHYSQALKRGETLSVSQYLAQNAKLLGIVKRPSKRPLLI